MEYRYDLAGGWCVSDQSNPTPAAACDEASGSWFYTYDDAGRLDAVIDPVGVVTQHCYDIDGNAVARIDGLGSTQGEPDLVDCDDIPSGARATITATDRLGRVTSVTDPSGVVTAFRYDPAGRRTHVITAQGTASEHVVEEQYDSAGRRSATVTPPPNVAGFDWWEGPPRVGVTPDLCRPQFSSASLVCERTSPARPSNRRRRP